MFYEDVIRSLQDHKVRYLVIGGAAVILHGVPRMTGDLDIAIDLTSGNVNAFLNSMEVAGLTPAAPIDPSGLADLAIRKAWQEEKNMKALTFQRQIPNSPYREVDVVLEVPIPFEEMYASRVELEAGDLILTLVSVEHLKEIKRRLGREQDLADIESLDKIFPEQE